MTIRAKAAVLAAAAMMAGSALALAAVAQVLADDGAASQHDEVSEAPSAPVESEATTETPSPEVSVEIVLRPGLSDSDYQELAPRLAQAVEEERAREAARD